MASNNTKVETATTYVVNIKTRDGWRNAYANDVSFLSEAEALARMKTLQEEDVNEYKVAPLNAEHFGIISEVKPLVFTFTVTTGSTTKNIVTISDSGTIIIDGTNEELDSALLDHPAILHLVKEVKRLRATYEQNS